MLSARPRRVAREERHRDLDLTDGDQQDDPGIDDVRPGDRRLRRAAKSVELVYFEGHTTG